MLAMAEIKEFVERKVSEVVSLECDICNRSYSKTEPEFDEFLRIWHQFNYGSTEFGDLTIISADICETCVKKVMSGF